MWRRDAPLLPPAKAVDILIMHLVGSKGMADSSQLDLFGDRPALDESSRCATTQPIGFESLSDDALISAIPDVTLANAVAVTTEVGKRRLMAAIPALVSLCNRFVGYGASAVVTEQVAALNALGAIGGPDAARAVSNLIAKKIVQGPTLVSALTVASELRVTLPNDVALNLIRDPNVVVRAAACGCVRSGYDVITALVSLIDSPDVEIVIASACALGRMGRPEALRPLKRHLIERPSRRIVEALARVADEEAIVLLARTGKARRELTESVISALEEIESPRATDVLTGLKRAVVKHDGLPEAQR